jgi:hypothetical protein
MVSGSDGFLDSLPGICAACFSAQKRTPHPHWYYCPHDKRFAIQCGFAWKTMRDVDAADLQRLIEDSDNENLKPQVCGEATGGS